MKKQKTDWLLYIIFILAFILILVAVVTVKTLKGESGKCVLNPIQYGVDTYAKQKNEMAQCTCNNLDKAEMPIIYTSNISVFEK